MSCEHDWVMIPCSESYALYGCSMTECMKCGEMLKTEEISNDPPHS